MVFLRRMVALDFHPTLVSSNSCHWTADAARKLQILGHNCNTLGMDGTQVAIFEEVDKNIFCCFLQC